MADMTQLTGAYAASWLPWLMIPLIFYILPFPIFAVIFLWIERENGSVADMGQDPQSLSSGAGYLPVKNQMGAEPTSPS